VFHGQALIGVSESAIRRTHRLGYDRDAQVYHCRRLSIAHGSDRCKVSVTIPFNPTVPWSGSVIGSEPDIGVEMMAHITLTSLCTDRLTVTVTLPIVLLPIRIRRTTYGSIAMRQCLTSRALTSTPG
jgi:hypothetical protein